MRHRVRRGNTVPELRFCLSHNCPPHRGAKAIPRQTRHKSDRSSLRKPKRRRQAAQHERGVEFQPIRPALVRDHGIIGAGDTNFEKYTRHDCTVAAAPRPCYIGHVARCLLRVHWDQP
jgi:hypothetical protein